MKKSYSKSKLWVVIIFVLFLSASFYSCDKDKDQDQQEILSGTTWSWESSSRDSIYMGSYLDNNDLTYNLYCNKIIISFGDSSASMRVAFSAYYPKFNNWASTQDFLGASYTYKGRNITIKPELERDFLPEQNWTGTVDKNTINLKNVFGSSVKLNKQ
jgi:hypothetical protein